jgi:hypothetical protein
VCDTATARCVACVTNADCGDNQVCRNQTCSAVDCAPTPCGARCGAVSDGCGADLDCGPCAGDCAAGQGLYFTEIHVGDPDYLVVSNRSSDCAFELDAFDIQISAGLFGLPLSATKVAFPAMVLKPGDRVYVTEAPIDATDVEAMSFLIGTVYNSDVRLCRGTCTGATTDQVVDHVVTVSPVVPAPPTFEEPLVALTDEAGQSYLRAAYRGASPTFYGSDWAPGPASRSTEPPPQ